MKKITLFTVTLGLSSISFAQLKYVIKAGITQSYIKESLASNYQDMNLKTGTQIGATLDISLIKNLSLRPSFQFTQKGFRAVEGNFDGPYYWDRNFSTTYLELPIDLVYKVSFSKDANIFIGSGPVLSFGLFGKGKGVLKGTDGTGQLYTQEGANNQPFKNPGYRTVDFGADFVTGLEFHRVIIAASYNHGLINILDYDHGIQNTKNRSFAFTIGYYVSKN